MSPPLWRHQEEAFRFVRSLWLRGENGALLAMAMGCGKSAVATKLVTADGARQLLVVSPLRVIPVWEQQLQRFAPNYFHVVALDDRIASVADKFYRARDIYDWSHSRQHPVAILINYDSARVDPFASWTTGRLWDAVIADECHRAKQPGGRTSKWLAKVGLMAARRLGLTGTPMPHDPLDIWAQFRFLNPHHLEPSYGQFKRLYAVMGGFFDKQIVGWRDLDKLEARFRQLAFRVDDSVLDLPPEMDETRSADLGPDGARIYQDMERDMIARIGDGTVTAANALVRLLRLAQITGGTLEDEDGMKHRIDTAKEELLEELLTDLNEPVVVFCRFRADLEAVHRVAKRVGQASLELSGTRDELKIWQGGAGAPYDLGRAIDGGGATEILAVQIQAGGVGVDLTRARVAIYYSLGYSLADYLQSRARIRRPPQTRPVVFYHLSIRNSIDEYIMRAVDARRDLVESVLKDLEQKGTKSDVVAG